MIDTDKYEGHTPAPWDAKPIKSCAWEWVSLGLKVPHDECFSEENTVNLALIADAPLLLEAYKRLREAIKVATIDLEEPNMHEETRKDLLDMLKRLVE